MSDYAKPLPRGEDMHGEFYQFCKQHELRLTLPGLWRLAPHATRELCGLRFVQLELGALQWQGPGV